MLDAALSWASRGFRVFPLRSGTNLPYGGSNWTQDATSDTTIIRRLWTGRLADHNIGVLTNDMIVIDVDVKDGKRGFESLLDLDLPLDTLTVRTPSGGLHLYYRGPNRANGVNRLGDGLDVRSWHGYVVAPGSETPKGRYTLSNEAAVLDAPMRLIERLDAPRQRSAEASKPLVVLDGGAAVAMATQFLLDDASVPNEGGRNAALFHTAAQVKDYGLSEPTALELISRLWNTRLASPLEGAELEKTIGSAYANGLLAPGVANPEAHYVGVDVSGFEAAQVPVLPSGLAALLRFRPFRAAHEIPPRPWVLKRMLIRGFVTTLVAPGSAGKSSLQLVIAAHMAMGLGFAGYELAQPGVPVKSIIINVEDDLDEMERRMLAVCVAYGFDPKVIATRIVILPGTEHFFKIADGHKQIKARVADIAALENMCLQNDIPLVIIDPLIETHDVDVNDNQALKSIMGLYRTLAQRAKIAVFIAHHTSKGSPRDSRAGDASAAMGASAIINSSRIAMTLFEANEADEKLGVPRARRHQYARLDDAKMNLSLRSGEPIWFRRESIDLFSGDSIGILRAVDLSVGVVSEVRRIADLLADELKSRNIMSATAYECVAFLAAADPLYAAEVYDASSHKAMQRKIEKFMAAPAELTGGGTIRMMIEKRSDTAVARKLIVLD